MRSCVVVGLALVLSVAASATADGDEPIDVVRVRVPTDKVQSVFPAGTELRGVPRDEFEALVDAARLADDRRIRDDSGPRLLRARHEARLDGETLIGRSELLIDAKGDPSSAAILDPWSPALTDEAAAGVVRVGSDRRLGVHADGIGPKAVSLSWQQRARAGSEGRGFDLGLPAIAACRLTLDLPESLVPEVAGTLRQGPAPGSSADRRTWRFDGPGGVWRVRLLTPRDGAGTASPVWLSGNTRIDASESPARWSLDWTVDPGPTGLRRFGLELPPGLELIDVTGRAVSSYRAEPAEGNAGTIVSVRLDDATTGPSPLTVRALMRVPDAGAWSIPAARPIGAVWTGGRTLVRLGAGQVVSACRTGASRQVVPTTSEREFGTSRAGLLLAFEGTGPASAAELTLRRSPTDSSAEVRGLVTLATREPPKLDAQITWRVDRGRLLNLAADMPSGWTAERVQVRGMAQATAWHAETRPGGGSRLVVHAPPAPDPSTPVTLDIAAISASGDRVGSMELPRIVPVGVRSADEVWRLGAEPGVIVSPKSARGLAWIDPATTGAIASESPRAQDRPAPVRPVLAWRWTAADGRGVLGLSASSTPRSAEAWTLATVLPDRLTLDHYVAIDASDRDVRDLVVAFTGPDSGAAPRWDVPGEPGRLVEASPIPPADRGALGLPAIGSAWRLAGLRGTRDRLMLHARTEGRWSGSGELPLLILPARDFARGSLLIRVDRGLRTEVKATGLAVFDPAWSWAAFRQAVGADSVAEASGTRMRASQTFGYDVSSDSPTLRTEVLPVAAPGGLVQEAILDSRSGPDGRARHRLLLRIVPGRDRTAEITLPDGATLEAAQVEGRPASPIRTGARLRFALPAASEGRPTVDLVLGYLGPRGDGRVIRPDLPSVSLPCLAFSWGMDAPASRDVEAIGGLTETAPHSPGDSPLWPDLPGLGRPADNDASRRELNDRVRQDPPGDQTLGDWLTRLDGGRVPVVVDRAALEDAGWGPLSKLDAAELGPRNASASETFDRLGLRLSTSTGFAVVTSQFGGRPDDLDEFPAVAIRDAAYFGHDATDRFQSVARWRGEITPRPRGDAGTASPSPIRRFVSTGWPRAGAGLRLDDLASRRMTAVAIGLAVLAVGVAARRSDLRARSIALVLVLGSGLGWLLLGARGWAPVASAMVWGAVAVSCVWMGAAVRTTRRPPSRSGVRSTARRTRAIGSSLSAVLVISFLAWSRSPAPLLADDAATVPRPNAEAGAIVALLPYDPPLDPAAPATRVIVRLADYDRLLAIKDAPPPAAPGPALTSALHEVRRDGARDARVASAFDLWCPGPDASRWTFPAEEARDLTAQLDGRDVPVRIAAGGSTATVEVVGAGPHRLVVRRLVALARSAGGESLRLPVPPVALSRCRMEAATGGERVAFPTARGRTVARDGIVEAALGPVDLLDVRWSSRETVGPPAPRGECEAAILWDVEPAGDRVRLRITPTSDDGLARLTLALEPGLLVRSMSVPGAADAMTRTVPTGAIWEAPIEPPLAEGQPVTIELWRPRADGERAAPLRRLPRFEPLGLARFAGLIGVRRPERWTGRTGPADGGEPVGDEVFAAAWGELPEGAFTFAGAARFVGTPQLALGTGPPRVRPRVSPSVQVEIAPGRLDVRAEAAWIEEGGPVREAEVRIPRDLRVARVESAGLTDWTRPADDVIRLRFDAETVPSRRTIRLDGWVPIDGDPMAAGPSRSEADWPWASWRSVDVEVGSLAVSAPANVAFRLDRRQGLDATGPPVSVAGTTRAGFAVAPGATPGPLRWSVEPTGVNVRVQSLLTLHPDSAEWAASARYQIPWGPCPPIRLRLPSAWADAAHVEIVGSSIRPRVERSGAETSWTFTPDPPIWGSLQVFVHASRPRPTGAFLAFPDLLPLGRPTVDRVESYLGYADASGRLTIVEGSAELQPVDASRWDASDLPWPPALPRNVFRVVKDGWSLRFQSPGEPSPGGASQGEAAVTLADLDCTLSPDGTLLGRASYDLDGPAASFLAVAIPDGAVPLGASVDGQAVAPRRDGTGRILLPLPESGASRVMFVWRGPSGPPGPDGRRALPLATLATDVPTLLTVSAPADMDVTADAATASPADLALARVQTRARTLAVRLEQFDRSSDRAAAVLLGALVRFELQVRAAARAAVGANDFTTTAGQSIRESLAIARTTLMDALAAAGLEDFAQSARARVGLSAGEDPLASQPAAVEPPAPLRVRPLGRDRTFRSDPKRPLAVRWSPRTDGGSRIVAILPATIGLLAMLGLALLAPRRPRLATVLIGASAAGLAIVAGGGLTVPAVVLAAALLGWLLP